MDEYIAEKLDRKQKLAAPPSSDDSGPTPQLAIKPTRID
jgi:hypothetical protein